MFQAPANIPITVQYTSGSNNTNVNVFTDATGSVDLQYFPQKSDYFYISVSFDWTALFRRRQLSYLSLFQASSSVATSAYKYPQKPPVTSNAPIDILEVTVLTKK